MAYVATGRAASDPELHQLPDGGVVCTFRLATSRLDRCGNPQVEWFTVRVVDEAVHVARSVASNGAELRVSGTLRSAPRESGSAGNAGMLIDAATVTRAAT